MKASGVSTNAWLLQQDPMHGLKLVVKEDALPLKEQPEFPALAELAKRGLLAPDTWNCKRAQISLKATIDVPMLGTIIEQNYGSINSR